MSKDIQPDLLRYVSITPRTNTTETLEAYRCWHETWKDAFQELGSAKQLYSDDFTRQDLVGAIFQEQECIALSFFRWVDLSSPMARQDSYFQAWPEACLNQLAREGSNICVSSNFTLAQEWRRSQVVSLKDVLVALIIERFLRSTADTVCGTVRNNRSVDKLIYRNGFVPIQQDATMHGVKVDLAAFYRTLCYRTPTTFANEAVVQQLLRTM